MEKTEIATLVQQARTGDEAAMARLLELAYGSVIFQCRKIMQHPEDAEDMAQEVLLQVYQNLDKLQDPEKFLSWANRIAAYMCINQRQRHPKDLQFLEDERGHSFLDTIEDEDRQHVPDAAMDHAETARLVTDLIDALPEAQRTVIYLYYYSEMSVREIAALTGVSENTVKSRLNYGRKALKDGVLGYEKDGIKLYSLSPLPFLLFLLRGAAESQTDPAAAADAAKTILAGGAAAAAGAAGTAVGSTVVAETAVAAGTSAAAGTGGILGAVSVKVAATVLAGVVAVGGIAAGVTLSRDEPEPPAQEIVETLAEEPVIEEPVMEEPVVEEPVVEEPVVEEPVVEEPVVEEPVVEEPVVEEPVVEEPVVEEPVVEEPVVEEPVVEEPVVEEPVVEEPVVEEPDTNVVPPYTTTRTDVDTGVDFAKITVVKLVFESDLPAYQKINEKLDWIYQNMLTWSYEQILADMKSEGATADNPGIYKMSGPHVTLRGDRLGLMFVWTYQTDEIITHTDEEYTYNVRTGEVWIDY